MKSTYFDGTDYLSYTGDTISYTTGVTILGRTKLGTTVGDQALVELSGRAQLLAFAGILALTDAAVGVSRDLLDDSMSNYNINTTDWLYWVVQISGTSANSYLSIDDGQTFEYETKTPLTVSATWSFSKIWIANNSLYDDRCRGQYQHVRVFDRVLTQEEMLAEITCISLASPWAAWELNETDQTDSSGNGRDLNGGEGTTEIGTEESYCVAVAADNAIFMGMSF